VRLYSAGIETSVSCMLGKHFTTEWYPYPLGVFVCEVSHPVVQGWAVFPISGITSTGDKRGNGLMVLSPRILTTCVLLGNEG
jgi:hypothetical protein